MITRFGKLVLHEFIAREHPRDRPRALIVVPDLMEKMAEKKKEGEEKKEEKKDKKS